MTSRSPSISAILSRNLGAISYKSWVSLDCSVYWYSLLEMRPVMLMFWTFWKYTAMPGTTLAVRRRRWITAVEFSPRSFLGLSAMNMRPILSVGFGPPAPTVELT